MGRASFLAVVCVMASLGGPANAFHSALAPLGCRSRAGAACVPLRAGAKHQGLRGAVAKRDESMIKLLAHLVVKNSAEAAIRAQTAFDGPQKIYKAVKKASGASTMLIEYARNDKVKPHDIAEYSYEARRTKAAIIVVDASPDGGDEDVAKFVKEQSKARTNFPGPVPIVYRGKKVTLETVALVKKLGVDGLALRGDQHDPESLTKLVAACHKANIEPVMEVSDIAQINAAVEAGGRVICVRFETDMVAKFLTKAASVLVSDIPPQCATIATVKARQGGSEVEQVRSLTDAGYHGVLLSQMVSDANEPTAIPYMKYITNSFGSKRSQSLKINEVKGLNVGYGEGAGYGAAAGFGEGTHA